eukprot:COSAG04_NODE_22711_length_350_cov_1.011952_1_plen_32_part_01
MTAAILSSFELERVLVGSHRKQAEEPSNDGHI